MFLGQFGNQTVALTLTNLTPHTEVELSFDLFIIRSWDGLGGDPPEVWSVSVGGGPALLRTTFTPFYDNAAARQSYPAWQGHGNFPANTGATETFSLGYSWAYLTQIFYWDAVYNLNFRFPHSAGSLVLNFAASGLETLDNESWGLDNVVVAVDSIASNAPPRITRQPHSQAVALNASAAFTVVATTNAPATYQWRLNKADLAGQINSYLVIPRAQFTNAGFYSVVVRNAFGSTDSQSARLTVGPTPAPPPPFDSIARQNNDVALDWSVLGANAGLESTDDLTPPAEWTIVAPTLGQTNDQVIATVPLRSTNQFFRLRSGPTLTDFWDGKAVWVGDAKGLGHDFGFHFPVMLRGDRDIWAYYIANYSTNGQIKSAVGRARSTDGLTWVNDGIVLDIGGVPRWIYQSEQQQFVIYHNVGRVEADGWSANPALDGPGHMVFGPYTGEIAGGTNTAIFRLMIDERIGPNEVVANIDVNDGAALRVLATRDIYRNEFLANFRYQDFLLRFTNRFPQNLEFRVWFADRSYVKSDYAAVAQGNAPHWDDRLASFPGIWKDGATWYLVYEGAAEDIPFSPGDIGLATSPDGRRFVKQSSNPILRHNTSGWEAVNIGTPSLYKENGVWYLFYHGFDGIAVRVGVATGASLTNLTKYPGNPILSTVSGTWEAGTVGRRSSIVNEGPYYYFAYEGSTDQPFSRAKWSSGLARSTNLLDWIKFPSNPILPQTLSGFGYDGPELIQIGGSWYLYVRMAFDPEAPTKRYRLVPK